MPASSEENPLRFAQLINTWANTAVINNEINVPATATQFDSVDSANITLNGQPLDQALSAQ